jgi:hypothetical protein
MHVEPPGHAPQSLREFATHYLMIVLGILTAVGIEQGIESIHHRELAAQATRDIEVELRGNLHEASTAFAENRKRLAELKATEEALTQDVLRKDASPATFEARMKTIAIGVATPALRRDAWEAAIASQALSYVDPATVRRYSEGYSAQREVTQTIIATFNIGNWPSELQGSVVDAKLGKVDQVALLKALATYEMALAAAAENERELQEAFKAAIGPQAGEHS